MKKNITINELLYKVKKFRDDRDWKQFHTPKNLVMALSVEVSELSEIFLWTEVNESFERAKEKRESVKEEMADVLIYLLSLSDVLDIDLSEAVEQKIKKNSLKYPIDKAKGISKKYTEL